MIKYQALSTHLNQRLSAVYMLIGAEPYLLNDSALKIKTAWKKQGETDEKHLIVQAEADWNALLEEANHYSLFSEYVLLDVQYDKKTIDAKGKALLTRYTQNINPRCLILFRAPLLPAKSLQWLEKNQHAQVVQAAPLSSAALLQWISTELKRCGIRHDPQIPALIHQYTQGNLLACAQCIEKLSLLELDNTPLKINDVMEQLTDQCQYALYELTDACLNADGEKVIHLLRQARIQRVEPPLVLWLLTQEIRLLLELSHLLRQGTPLPTACTQLKIWPQKANAYQRCLAHFSRGKLYQLLSRCNQLDTLIKSNASEQIWHAFEQLALTLCRLQAPA